MGNRLGRIFGETKWPLDENANDSREVVFNRPVLGEHPFLVRDSGSTTVKLKNINIGLNAFSPTHLASSYTDPLCMRTLASYITNATVFIMQGYERSAYSGRTSFTTTRAGSVKPSGRRDINTVHKVRYSCPFPSPGSPVLRCYV